jgi:maltooligosyltrehalose trehalohydrolase
MLHRTLGAVPDQDGVVFRVFAPNRRRVTAVLADGRSHVLAPEGHGYFRGRIPGAGPGDRYHLRLDGEKTLPDPVSRSQPLGVHGPSEVVDLDDFGWGGERAPELDPDEMVVYELHAGAFTPEGTLEAVIPRLAELKALGADAVELMPVAAFPGRRNWGYDGVFPFAVHAGYGGSRGLQRLVRAAHEAGLAVLLDVVYNHLGPEGCVHQEFAPYARGAAGTPWGRSMNVDGPHGHGVRRHFVENALQWLADFRVDGLRLDAVHEIRDASATHFLEELSREVRGLSSRTGRHAVLVAESGRNDPRLVSPWNVGGYGLDAMWGFDFHHALHALLTGEHCGYYADFGSARELAMAMAMGFVLKGEYSRFRRTTWGRLPVRPDGELLGSGCFVRYAQSHDEAGNRPWGRRLSRLTDLEGLKLAAFATLLTPGPAMLFMGEEYGETKPFHYFADFDNPRLNAAVRRGRRRDMRGMGFTGRSRDPASKAALRESVLDWTRRERGRGRMLLDFHATLIRARRELARMGLGAAQGCRAEALAETAIRLIRPRRGRAVSAAVLNFSGETLRLEASKVLGRNFRLVLDTASRRWKGPGGDLPEAPAAGEELVLPPRSAGLYVKEAAAGSFTSSLQL